MKLHRLFLLVVATASLVLLTGFKKTSVNTLSPIEKQTASVEVKKAKTTKQKKIKHPDSNNQTQKSLDLSIPFTEAWVRTEQNQRDQQESKNIFTTEKKKTRPIDLAGQMIMSQEPETDKRKSVDGAAIVINLKR